MAFAGKNVSDGLSSVGKKDREYNIARQRQLAIAAEKKRKEAWLAGRDIALWLEAEKRFKRKKEVKRHA